MAKGQNKPRVGMEYCCLLPERVELTLNNKKETNGKIEMGQGQNGPRVKMGQRFTVGPKVYCCLLPERVELTVNSNKEKMAGSKWTKSQDRPRVKMGYYCLPPERVELTLNSKNE